jgi:diadenosine tetraphosphate (Ap4A) HIT family hydrolase
MTCTYCLDPSSLFPGTLVWSDESWSVGHGPAAVTRAGGLKVVSKRHFVDFHEMTPEESTSFGALLSRLDGAIRTVTAAERVHLISTRDRVQHFHAWLYPRYVEDQLRGADFLAAPQSATDSQVEAAVAALRGALAPEGASASA